MQRAASSSASDTSTPEPLRRVALHLALTLLGCIAAGAATLALTIPPGFGSPLNPAAGVALACVLAYGWRALASVAVAAFVVSLVASAMHGHHAAYSAATPLAIAAIVSCAATLQALVAAALVRRVVRQPLTLTLPRDVAAFMAACMASSLVAASVLTLALAGGAVRSGSLVTTWGLWWIGDLAGLLLATPIVLTLIGRPRSEWAPRRLSVGVTMTLVVAFLALGIVQAARWNGERLRAVFAHDAASAALTLTNQLEDPLSALEALRGVFSVARHPSRADMHLVSQRWIELDTVNATGWSERVHREDIDAFEARNRAEGALEYRVFDRSGIGATSAAGAQGAGGEPALDPGDVFAVRYVEPPAAGSAALGVNALSVRPARAAVMLAIDSGRPAATTSFVPDVGEPRGVVVFQAVYDGDPTTPDERRAAVRGLVFVAMALDAQLASIADKVPAYLRLCVVDSNAAAAARRLFGPPGCDTEKMALVREQPLAFAERPWSVRVSADPDEVPNGDGRSAWTVAVVGLLSAALLVASLLITTGRTRRIESAVRERTAALRAEVNERHIAETALRASEQRFRNILDNVPIGVVYTDLAGRVIQANPRYCELTGYGEGELAALAPAALTHPDDLAQDEALTAQLVTGAIPMYRRHKRCLNRDGAVVWVRSTVSLLRDGSNAPWRIVGVVEDITEHLRLEEAERAREAAEASNRAKSDFLSRMSHELRTPLNAMLGFAQLLEIDRRHPLTPAQRPWVGQIQQAGWHLLEMINDVLDLSRIESGNLRLETTTLELDEIVQATTALVAGDAARRGIRISTELAPGSSGVLGDATRVKQILTNLLSNAVKYNVDNGRVHVASRLASPELVEISVTDTGMGMTPPQMEELFRPFNRLGREHTALQGTGIGLVISRRLAELMGGSIRVKSVPGEGSSFILKLPKAVDPDTVRSNLDSLESAPADYHRRIVHYIEDNETNVEVMRGVLAQRTQVQMVVSLTGGDGLAAVRARLPHLLLLDMHLPDIAGLEVL
ncbi:MAG: ATP-binding protein, partial [Caldimonas sp.]